MASILAFSIILPTLTAKYQDDLVAQFYWEHLNLQLDKLFYLATFVIAFFFDTICQVLAL